jgi:hypothetical protein
MKKLQMANLSLQDISRLPKVGDPFKFAGELLEVAEVTKTQTQQAPAVFSASVTLKETSKWMKEEADAPEPEPSTSEPTLTVETSPEPSSAPTVTSPSSSKQRKGSSKENSEPTVPDAEPSSLSVEAQAILDGPSPEVAAAAIVIRD